ncbi:unnamed protein product [Musa acuminata subsp. malaccensis]|uniref:(wild Malaysian banana) hypothetical protein n=1 Tax=Musa acuminata subsp. malaccensis TaxID=214687 RepID=A0A8D7B4K0_MUSAM|nr:unnamed protein product [Musa acuminata subsp. malaccensis]
MPSDDVSVLPGHGRTVCVTGANGHLRALDGAKERQVLAKADLLDVQSLRAAIHGCDGAFHMASPVTDYPEQVIEPAITGTRNVIDAAVRRVVLTSSVGAVYMNPNRGLDESCWSDLRHRKNTKVITIIIVNHQCLNLDSRLNHVNHESSITKVRRRQGRRRGSRKGGRGEGCQGALRMRREHAATGGGRPSEYSPSSSRSTPSPQSIPYLFVS